MRHEGENERRRLRFVISVDAKAKSDPAEEINRIYQLLRNDYANRNLTVGGVRDMADPRRMR